MPLLECGPALESFRLEAGEPDGPDFDIPSRGALESFYICYDDEVIASGLNEPVFTKICPTVSNGGDTDAGVYSDEMISDDCQSSRGAR